MGGGRLLEAYGESKALRSQSQLCLPLRSVRLDLGKAVPRKGRAPWLQVGGPKTNPSTAHSSPPSKIYTTASLLPPGFPAHLQITPHLVLFSLHPICGTCGHAAVIVIQLNYTPFPGPELSRKSQSQLLRGEMVWEWGGEKEVFLLGRVSGSLRNSNIK